MNIIKFNNSILKYDGKWLNSDVTPTPPHPDYNPLNLPPNTFRVRTSDGNIPYRTTYTNYETATLVSGTTDVYDVYQSGTSLYKMLYGSKNIAEVLGANTSNITNMNDMFAGCISLETVPLFDTSSVTDMGRMFQGCYILTSVPLFDTHNVTDMSEMFGTNNRTTTELTSVPLFDTSSVTNMNYMFLNCRNVQSGALALYQQISSRPNPLAYQYHTGTFRNCGINTVNGAAELEQISDMWK